MPSRSKAQFKWMKMIENGSKHVNGLSPEKAKEFTEGVDYKSLPDKKKPKKK